MARLLMMLCPPRSFSSLVSTMIGQHPEIYGFPELHLVMRGTVGEVIEWGRKRRQYLGSQGLLRALAELEFGGQSTENVLSAANWLEDRRDWKSKDALQYIMEKASAAKGAKFCLEKTPTLVFQPSALNRVRKSFPNALYIHVTRHPVNLKKSLDEYIANLPRLSEEEKRIRLENSMTAWPLTQRNILDFCATLAPGQYLRLRGEDVLADAENMMRQVAEWLQLRTDDEAIAAMLRPEDSPYARPGPAIAPFGNDPKFISSPKFRPGKPTLGSLKDFLENGDGAKYDQGRRDYLTQLANCLGYQ